jgi:hypothetical protein
MKKGQEISCPFNSIFEPKVCSAFAEKSVHGTDFFTRFDA